MYSGARLIASLVSGFDSSVPCTSLLLSLPCISSSYSASIPNQPLLDQNFCPLQSIRLQSICSKVWHEEKGVKVGLLLNVSSTYVMTFRAYLEKQNLKLLGRLDHDGMAPIRIVGDHFNEAQAAEGPWPTGSCRHRLQHAACCTAPWRTAPHFVCFASRASTVRTETQR